MNWSDYAINYNEVFPKPQPTKQRVVETPTGLRVAENTEVIDEPNARKPVEHEETEHEETEHEETEHEETEHEDEE